MDNTNTMENPTQTNPGSEKPLNNPVDEAEKIIKEVTEEAPVETGQDEVEKARKAVEQVEEPKPEETTPTPVEEAPEEKPTEEEKTGIIAGIKKLFGR